jgi:threonine dehydrogenase-like Zn-dependent dehydrogenase
VVGAGPIGLLAALLGVQRGYQVHVLDQVTDGPKPPLVARLGATYHHGGLDGLDLTPDVVVECTGIGELVAGVAAKMAPAGVICLAGLASGGRRVPVDLNVLNSEVVLENAVIFGTVNAAKRNYIQAVDALARADPAWLGDLITRRVPLSRWPDALARQPGDVKVTVDLTD